MKCFNLSHTAIFLLQTWLVMIYSRLTLAAPSLSNLMSEMALRYECCPDSPSPHHLFAWVPTSCQWDTTWIRCWATSKQFFLMSYFTNHLRYNTRLSLWLTFHVLLFNAFAQDYMLRIDSERSIDVVRHSFSSKDIGGPCAGIMKLMRTATGNREACWYASIVLIPCNILLCQMVLQMKNLWKS